MKKVRLTMAQALIRFLKNQYVERDRVVAPFFAGCFGIFGHGNVAGIGQALKENPSFRYFQARNEQAMVHTAVAYARMKNRLAAFALTSSIGPGATNMVTGAALATINRLPVLLLPGDIFAKRSVAPVLQQLESGHSQDISVNDCFKPVSKYWDRIQRPEQLISSLTEAMRVLVSPSETGAVTLCLPQDVQVEAYDYPQAFFEERTWTVPRPRADASILLKAKELIAGSKSPLIIAGGGVIYSEASEPLSQLAMRAGIPVAETQAGKGSLAYDHPLCVGAMGVTGSEAANILARQADLVIGIGTRYSDFTTASKTAFQNEQVRFININICEFDSYKHNALPVVADAKVTLEELSRLLADFETTQHHREMVERLRKSWSAEVDEVCGRNKSGGDELELGADSLISQAHAVGAINDALKPHDVVVCAAGSLPGDLHKLWRSREPKTYHVEYGYSCMGYEIAGGIGVKMADPGRHVCVMVGDGSYLMMAQEIVTAVQEHIDLTIVLLDNHGFASIGALSEGIGGGRFGTRYRFRDESGQLEGTFLPIDLVTNAASMGANAVLVRDLKELKTALEKARTTAGVNVIVARTNIEKSVRCYESWWDVPIAEVSQSSAVQQARKTYEQCVRSEVGYYAPAQTPEAKEKTAACWKGER
ncbi:MAG TPA: 3D-(3,5/4)-trihydroxycyclohexane-1,2-dione acylhydrolase (decyclizing) [Candidatus Obscuribacterales bacterium]